MNGYNPYNQYPYSGYGYQAFNSRQFMQPQQQSQPQPMQYETPIQDVRFVTSEEAKAFIVMPNSKALLIDPKGGMAHLKAADNMGQSVTQHFKFEQVNIDGSPIKKQEKREEVDFTQFVTISQYNELLTKFEALKDMFHSHKQPQGDNKPVPAPQSVTKANTQSVK
jgi:hypothetical protein